MGAGSAANNSLAKTWNLAGVARCNAPLGMRKEMCSDESIHNRRRTG